MSNHTTQDTRAALGRALFAATLLERVRALPTPERHALAAAIDRARFDAPADITLVELAALVTAAEGGPIDA